MSIRLGPTCLNLLRECLARYGPTWQDYRSDVEARLTKHLGPWEILEESNAGQCVVYRAVGGSSTLTVKYGTLDACCVDTDYLDIDSFYSAYWEDELEAAIAYLAAEKLAR